jgi:hypothetical protein
MKIPGTPKPQVHLVLAVRPLMAGNRLIARMPPCSGKNCSDTVFGKTTRFGCVFQRALTPSRVGFLWKPLDFIPDILDQSLLVPHLNSSLSIDI